jgi:hypothetical protein
MGPLFVVTVQPFGTDLPDLVERLKHIGTEDLGPIRPIEAFNEGILIRLA